MKKSILSGMLVLLMSFGALANVNQDQPNELKKLQEQVQEIIGKNSHKFPMEEDYIARISFIINQNNELVVVDTDCNDSRILSHIRSTLNYKKVTAPLSGEFSKFVIPVRFKKSTSLAMK